MNLLDLMRDPMVVRPVDPYGHVVQGPAQEKLCWRKGYRSAVIELHPADETLWMWSVSFSLTDGGCGYKVGSKWGRFACSRDDALFYAVEELAERLSKRAYAAPEAPAVLAWARELR